MIKEYGNSSLDNFDNLGVTNDKFELSLEKKNRQQRYTQARRRTEEMEERRRMKEELGFYGEKKQCRDWV